MARSKDTKYDNLILEFFCMQLNANEVFQKINYQQLLKEEPPLVGRSTIYRRYADWVNQGRKGALELIRTEEFDDSIVSYWRLESKKG